MKKILIAAAALATLTGAAGAASAQQYYGPGYGYDRGDGHYGRDHDGRYDRYDRRGDSRAINLRQQELRDRIDRGVRTGRLTFREAETLRAEVRNINWMERHFRANGLNYREVQILNDRLDRLERRVYAEMRDGQRYGYGYGYGHGDRDRRY